MTRKPRKYARGAIRAAILAAMPPGREMRLADVVGAVRGIDAQTVAKHLAARRDIRNVGTKQYARYVR